MAKKATTTKKAATVKKAAAKQTIKKAAAAAIDRTVYYTDGNYDKFKNGKVVKTFISAGSKKVYVQYSAGVGLHSRVGLLYTVHCPAAILATIDGL